MGDLRYLCAIHTRTSTVSMTHHALKSHLPPATKKKTTTICDFKVHPMSDKYVLLICFLPDFTFLNVIHMAYP